MTSKPGIVVVGASAGGVQGLQDVVAGLPADLDAAVFVVLHIRPDVASNLAHILSRHGPLPAAHPDDGEPVRRGCIYVARPDHHLLVDGERIAVSHGPKENRFRPSIDALFRSAAYTRGADVVGVVLSGALDDGASGLWSIKRMGGVTIVQDPQQAPFDSMPLSALRQVDIDRVLPAERIGPAVAELLAARAGPGAAAEPPAEVAERMGIEVQVAASANAFRHGIMRFGEPSVFTCPECHGALVRLAEDALVRYRCHTGHGFTAGALLAGITDSIEPTLWEVTRALEESVMLLDDTAHHLTQSGRPEEAARFFDKARRTARRAHALQALTIRHEHLSPDALLDAPEDDGSQDAGGQARPERPGQAGA